MVVDKLGPLSQIFLRAQVARGEPPRVPSTPLGGMRSSAAGSSTAAQASFEQRVMQQLIGISAEDPRRRQRAIRAFLEIRLLDEFGSELANDAAFQQLVDDVLATMQRQEPLIRDLDEAADRLLAQL